MGKKTKQVHMHIAGEEDEGILDGEKRHTGGSWNGVWGNQSGYNEKKADRGKIVRDQEVHVKEPQFYSLNIKASLKFDWRSRMIKK